MRAGLDSTFANWSYSPIYGSALAQSFWANDTIITGLTVWRPAGNTSNIGATIYMTAANGAGMPLYNYVYHAGPTVVVYDSTPPGGIIPMRFTFDPPVLLPERGEYAFFLQPQGCWPGAAWYIMSDTLDDYRQGDFWETGRAITGCTLGPVIAGANTDFAFEVECCRDALTPTRRSSWGELKLLYR